MSKSRKRLRSEEDNFTLQSKYFINQKLVDESNGNLMKNVYDKTLEKIFNGAKILYESSHNEAAVEDKNNSLIIDSLDDKTTEIVGCQSCIRDLDPSTNFQCNKCHLRLCSKCCVTCQSCQSVALCDFCVNSGCRLGDMPMCDRCIMFYED